MKKTITAILVLIRICIHDWEYQGDLKQLSRWGITRRQKRCRKCGKVIIEKL